LEKSEYKDYRTITRIAGALIARVKDLSEKRYMDCYVSYGDTQKRKGEVITSLEKSEYEDYRTIAGSVRSKRERTV